MTTTYADVQPLRDAGQTAAQIADALTARKWTSRPIPVGDLIDWLRSTRLGSPPQPVARLAIGGGWEGVLPAMVESGQLPAELSDAVRELLSHLGVHTSQQVDTHESPYGALLDGIASAVGITTEQRTALYALGGGERYADADATRVQALIDEHDAERQRQDWQTRFDAAINTIGTAEQSSGVADVRAIADELEAA